MQQKNTSKTELANHIGTIVKNLNRLHETEPEVGFGLHSVTFFQKLVSETLIKHGVGIDTKDFYKGLLFLDYFCKILEDDYKVCDNLRTISEKLKEIDDKKSYVTLEIIAEEAGLLARERGEDYYRKKESAIKKRYEAEGKVELTRKADPYYEAIGQMVLDAVSAERQGILEDVDSRSSISATVFTDSILGVLKDTGFKAQAEDLLAKKDYFGASLKALEGLAKEASLERLKAAAEKRADE